MKGTSAVGDMSRKMACKCCCIEYKLQLGLDHNLNAVARSATFLNKQIKKFQSHQ